jgi:hypothetical protein
MTQSLVEHFRRSSEMVIPSLSIRIERKLKAAIDRNSDEPVRRERQLLSANRSQHRLL